MTGVLREVWTELCKREVRRERLITSAAWRVDKAWFLGGLEGLNQGKGCAEVKACGGGGVKR